MIHSIGSFISGISVGYWIIILGSSIFIALFMWWKHANQLTFFDFLVKFPVQLFDPIGLLKKLKKDTTNLDTKVKWVNGLSRQEKRLCDEYMQKIGRGTSEIDFNNANEYLAATGQESVTPMRPWMWMLLFLLTAGEAAGTGALLAEYVSTMVTANEAVFFTWGTALFFAAALLFLTHRAGREFYTKKTIKKILGPLDSEAKPSGYTDKDKATIKYDQSKDENNSSERRFYARLEKPRDRGSVGWGISAIILLFLIFVGVFGLRWYGVKQQNTMQIVRMEKNGVQGAGSAGGGSNPFAQINGGGGVSQSLPPAVKQAQAQVRKNAAQTIGHDLLGQGFAAAALLSLFYILVQGVGFGLSQSHSFFEKGDKHYKTTHGKASYDAFLNKYFYPYAQLAEARLSELRDYYAHVNEDYAKLRPTTSFIDYFHNQNLQQKEQQQQDHNSGIAGAGDQVGQDNGSETSTNQKWLVRAREIAELSLMDTEKATSEAGETIKSMNPEEKHDFVASIKRFRGELEEKNRANEVDDKEILDGLFGNK